MTFDLVRLKHATVVVMGQAPPSEAVNEDGDGVPFLQGNAEFGPLHPTAKRYATKAAKRCRKGDVLMSVRAPVGAFNVADREYGLGRGLAAIRANGRIEPRFLWYSCGDIARQLQSLEKGSTYGAVTGDDFSEVRIALPQAGAQPAIADFLDRETERIDALVEKKRRLIELLDEKRTALISHVVTKGLDPTVPMKDSGIPWLGEIPAHWEAGSLKMWWTVIDCKHRTSTYVEDGIPLVGTVQVKPGRLSLDGAKQTTEAEYLDLIEGGRRPEPGDIIYSRNASLGSAAYVEIENRFCMGQDVCLIRSDSESQLYLMYLLSSAGVLQQVDSLVVGATFKRINVDQIKNYLVVHPPRPEQEAIGRHLDERVAAIDLTQAKIGDQLKLLAEYRQALITAAVTGQFEVDSGEPRQERIQIMNSQKEVSVDRAIDPDRLGSARRIVEGS